MNGNPDTTGYPDDDGEEGEDYLLEAETNAANRVSADAVVVAGGKVNNSTPVNEVIASLPDERGDPGQEEGKSNGTCLKRPADDDDNNVDYDVMITKVVRSGVNDVGDKRVVRIRRDFPTPAAAAAASSSSGTPDKPADKKSGPVVTSSTSSPAKVAKIRSGIPDSLEDVVLNLDAQQRVDKLMGKSMNSITKIPPLSLTTGRKDLRQRISSRSFDLPEVSHNSRNPNYRTQSNPEGSSIGHSIPVIGSGTRTIIAHDVPVVGQPIPSCTTRSYHQPHEPMDEYYEDHGPHTGPSKIHVNPLFRHRLPALVSECQPIPVPFGNNGNSPIRSRPLLRHPPGAQQVRFPHPSYPMQPHAFPQQQQHQRPAYNSPIYDDYGQTQPLTHHYQQPHGRPDARPDPSASRMRHEDTVHPRHQPYPIQQHAGPVRHQVRPHVMPSAGPLIPRPPMSHPVPQFQPNNIGRSGSLIHSRPLLRQPPPPPPPRPPMPQQMRFPNQQSYPQVRAFSPHQQLQPQPFKDPAVYDPYGQPPLRPPNHHHQQQAQQHVRSDNRPEPPPPQSRHEVNHVRHQPYPPMQHRHPLGPHVPSSAPLIPRPPISHSIHQFNNNRMGSPIRSRPLLRPPMPQQMRFPHHQPY